MKAVENDIKEDKYFRLFHLFEKWLTLKEDGKTIADVLRLKGIKKIAIYGCSKAGEHLLEELRESDVEVCYFIDRYAGYNYLNWKVVSPDSVWGEVDAIILTMVSGYEEIIKIIRNKRMFKCEIFKLEDLVYESLQMVTIKEI